MQIPSGSIYLARCSVAAGGGAGGAALWPKRRKKLKKIFNFSKICILGQFALASV